MIMAVDVLDDDDRRIDQQAQRQDQREQSDAVDRHPAKQIGAKGDREDDGHRHRNDQRLAPAEEQQHDEADGDERDRQMLHQPVDGLVGFLAVVPGGDDMDRAGDEARLHPRSEEHTSELQSLMRISYAVFCLKKKNKKSKYDTINS